MNKDKDIHKTEATLMNTGVKWHHAELDSAAASDAGHICVAQCDTVHRYLSWMTSSSTEAKQNSSL